ncbi:MAG TPA: formyltetrahydrofolate deformylase [Microbacteriaceae bacterium]|nr:formyltetrahydrofolate deformylase [Microbacteriaceae bacterium]
MTTKEPRPVLVVSGTDRPGIVTAISKVLTDFGANIVTLDQYSTDPQGGEYFQRVEFHLPDFAGQRAKLESTLTAVVTTQLGLDWYLDDLAAPKRVVILASITEHNLLDLLWRQRRGELNMTVPMVISNHEVLKQDVEFFGIPFHYVYSQGEDKSAAEREIIELVKGKADLVVLARYMQILSDDFINQIGAPVINIHHSFLPAFIGASPYRKAKERGVKLVGATAHYVTKDLDEGPIIEQDVVRVSHADSVAELTRKGSEVERQVLTRAVQWHLEDRVIRAGHQCIVFTP